MDTIHGLNLPEQVFRHIFRYISTEELRFTIRKLNKSFQKYIDDYLQCQGVFALTGGRNETTTLIHIFKRETKYIEVVSVVPMSLLKREHNPPLTKYPYDVNLYTLSTSLTDMDVPLLMEICYSNVSHRYLTTSLTTYIYRFDFAKYTWKILKARYAMVTGDIRACCPISDSSMIMLIDPCGSENSDIRIDMEDSSASKLQLIHLNMDSAASASVTNIIPVLPGYAQTFWILPNHFVPWTARHSWA